MYFNSTKCGSLVLCCLISLSLSAKDAKIPAGPDGLRKPLCFVENKGQVTDQDNKPRYDIQYKLSTPGMNLYVGNGQLHYQFKKVEGNPETGSNVSAYRMDVTLLGADPAAKVVAADQQDYFENYYLAQYGENGFTAHSWNKIVYKDVYPNIDWVLYVKDNKVEYDFNVRPGGKVSDIRLQYGGATSLKITADGSLAAETPMGRIQEKSPYAFEAASGKTVASKFKLRNNVVTFETGAYTGSLTIDPYLLWSTYFGGTAEDVITSVKVGPSPAFNTFVGGYVASNGLATVGAFRTTYQGGTYDAFLARYNSAGVLAFATYMGSIGNFVDQGSCIALENSGNNVYLAGTTNGPATGLTTGGAFHMANNGLNDGFLIKFNNSGVRQWCTFYGGPGNDNITAVTVDAVNNVYIAGQTASTSLIATTGAYQAARSGTTDAFVAMFSSTGAIQWSTYYGGTAQEQALAIACNISGQVVVTGQTNSVISMTTTGAHQAALSGMNDAFIAMFDNTGSRMWGTYYGGTGTEQGNDVVFEPSSGNIAVVGNTTSPSTTAIATAKAHQGTFGGGSQDAFVAYFNPTGTRLWGTYYGGIGLDYGEGICIDPFGNIVIAGGTFSANGIATAGTGMQSTIGGSYDAFVSKINNLGQRLWGTYFGGTFYDYANSVACDAANHIYLGGYTTSLGTYGSGGIVSSGAQQTTYGGGTYDGFLARFDLDTFVILNQPYTDTLVCAGGNLNVPYTVFPPGATFQPGNVFTIEMSDASGSFLSPTVIGSLTSIVSSVVPTTIPALTPLGTGYRLRIVASDPAFTSPDNFMNIEVVSSIPAAVATSNSPVCVGTTLNLFTSTPYSVASYSWSGPLGFVSGLQNPSITGVPMGAAGVYSVTTVHNGCPASVSTVTVTVNNIIPPTPIVTFSSGCAGSTVLLFANPDTIATGILYNWVGPAGFTSTMQNPTIPGSTTANSGFYFVSTVIGGCSSAQGFDTVIVNPVLPVSVNVTATPGFTAATSEDTICTGTLVTFTAIPVNGGSSPSYQWMSGISSPIVGAISNTWSSATLFDGSTIFCVLTSSVDCPLPATATSNVVRMNVIENAPIVYIAAVPGVHVTPGSNITFTSNVYNGGMGALYQWKKNGLNIPGATNNTYVLMGVTKRDTISLVVHSTMNCATPDSAVSNVLHIGTNVGVTNIAASLSDIGLFPNPNNGSFTVKGMLQGNDAVSFEITNLVGQIIYNDNATVTNNELNKTIDLANVPAGIYLLRVSQDGDSRIFRFAIQH